MGVHRDGQKHQITRRVPKSPPARYDVNLWPALDQINHQNVKQLRIAWRWKTENFGPSPKLYYEATPLMIKGVLYTTAGYWRVVAAIDGATGETLWTCRMDEGERGLEAPRRNSGRGLAYWTDGTEERIFLSLPDFTSWRWTQRPECHDRN